MKYRIKVNAEGKHYPQYRSWGFWCCFPVLDYYHPHDEVNYFSYDKRDAEQFLDNQYQRQKGIELLKAAKGVFPWEPKDE